MSYRIWIVDDKELGDEVIWQSKQPQHAKPSSMDDVQYNKLMRRLSYWYIIRDRVVSLAIISLLLLIALAAVVYFTSSNFSWITWGKIAGVVVVVNGLLYLLVYMIGQSQKRKLVY